MTNQGDGMAVEQKSAAERIEEVRRLNRRIVSTLDVVLDLIQQGDLKDIVMLPKQMGLLNEAVSRVQKLEAEFDDKHGPGLAAGDMDLGRMRSEIGCRLGRLRRCQAQGGLSQCPDNG